MTLQRKIIAKALVTAASQSLILFGLIVNIPIAQGAEELTAGNKLILEQLPPPRFGAQSQKSQCTNSNWKFTDITTEKIWDNILYLNNKESFASGPLIKIWVRGYFPENLAYVPAKYIGGGKSSPPCVDANFITRTWQASINTPVTGVLSKDDALPLIRVMDMVQGTNYGGHLEVNKTATTTVDIPSLRLGMTLDELRPNLQSWCRPSKLDPNNIVCNSSEQPCLKFNGVKNRQKLCESLQVNAPKYTVGGLPVYSLVFNFSSGHLASIYFRLEDYNRGIEALDARYGKPALKVEQFTEHSSRTDWEFTHCEHLDGDGKCVAGYDSVMTHKYVPVDRTLRTWKSGTLKIVEQQDRDFHLIPAGAK